MAHKPSWNDAPDWAKYLAQDLDGTWTWYSHKPFRENENCRWNNMNKDLRYKEAWTPNLGWRDTLEERPEVKNAE